MVDFYQQPNPRSLNQRQDLPISAGQQFVADSQKFADSPPDNDILSDLLEGLTDKELQVNLNPGSFQFNPTRVKISEFSCSLVLAAEPDRDCTHNFHPTNRTHQSVPAKKIHSIFTVTILSMSISTIAQEHRVNQMNISSLLKIMRAHWLQRYTQMSTTIPKLS